MKPIQSDNAFTLEAFLPYRLSVMSNRVSGAIARLYADRFDLTIPEWRVMAVLGQYGALTAGELVGRTAMDKVRISRAVQRLVQSGRVAAARDPDDGRRRSLELTEAGRAIHDRIVPLARAVESELLRHLKAEDRALLDNLFAILERAVDQLNTKPHRSAD